MEINSIYRRTAICCCKRETAAKCAAHLTNKTTQWHRVELEKRATAILGTPSAQPGTQTNTKPLKNVVHLVLNVGTLFRTIASTLRFYTNDLCSSSTTVWVIKSRRMRCAGHVTRIGEGRGVNRVWVGKPEGKRPLGWHTCRWEDNIKADLQEVGCGGMDTIKLTQVRDR
jgi:hypothetical protein